jgi:hypothetical protein
MFSTGAASGVAATLLADGLKRLSRRWSSTPTIEERPSADTAEGAWELFAAFLQRAFKAGEPQAIEVQSTPEGWGRSGVGRRISLQRNRRSLREGAARPTP